MSLLSQQKLKGNLAGYPWSPPNCESLTFQRGWSQCSCLTDSLSSFSYPRVPKRSNITIAFSSESPSISQAEYPAFCSFFFQCSSIHSTLPCPTHPGLSSLTPYILFHSPCRPNATPTFQLPKPYFSCVFSLTCCPQSCLKAPPICNSFFPHSFGCSQRSTYLDSQVLLFCCKAPSWRFYICGMWMRCSSSTCYITPSHWHFLLPPIYLRTAWYSQTCFVWVRLSINNK